MSVKRRKGHSDTDLIRPSKSTVNENQSELKEVAKDRKKTNKVGWVVHSKGAISNSAIVGTVPCYQFIPPGHSRCVHTTLNIG